MSRCIRHRYTRIAQPQAAPPLRHACRRTSSGGSARAAAAVPAPTLTSSPADLSSYIRDSSSQPDRAQNWLCATVLQFSPPRTGRGGRAPDVPSWAGRIAKRSEEHTSELQSHSDLVCRLLLEKKKKRT